MSVRVLNNNSSSNTDVKAKTLSSKLPKPWIRNPSWPACEANPGDNRVRGLYAVWPDGGNFIAMQNSQAYQVHFGDGLFSYYGQFSTAYHEYSYSAAALVGTEAPVTFTDAGDLVTRTAHGYSNDMRVQFFNITSTTGISNAQFYYVINATANTFQVAAEVGGTAVTLTTDGTAQLLPYRIATVTIAPQYGNNLTDVNLSTKHSQSGLVTGYSTGWLDLAFAASTITTLMLNFGSAGYHRNLERVRLNQLGAITSFSSLFSGETRLQNVEIADTVTSVTSMFLMFDGCSSLQTVPLFNTANVTSMNSVFRDCSSLQTVPLFNTANVTSMPNMFEGCSSLQTVPLFNTANVTNMSSMFLSCSSLQAVPLFNTAKVTNMTTMFRDCMSLQTVPLFNTALVTSMSSMFLGCSSLQTVPLFNIKTTGTVTMDQMFYTCYSLQAVPLFNTARVTTMGSMLYGCSSLQTVPLFNTALVTNMNSMVRGCGNLQTVPLFNTASVTNMNYMFAGCGNLQTVPLFNTTSVTNMGNMFEGCRNLQAVPLFNTANVTNMSTMFKDCENLQAIPALVVTQAGVNFFSFTFSFCVSLARIEAKDFNISFPITNCKLSATALNEIYTNLPTVVSKTISVTGNYGTLTDTPSIATAKGWTVTG